MGWKRSGEMGWGKGKGKGEVDRYEGIKERSVKHLPCHPKLDFILKLNIICKMVKGAGRFTHLENSSFIIRVKLLNP